MIKLHTNHGVITLKLDEEKAPETAANFKEYVKSGHYDNTVFHRVINNFMIQGGGFEPGMKQKPTRAPIKNEANNGLTNKVGSIAMARTMDPHSASAQFFINVADNDFLNHTAPTTQGWGYAVFGEVVEGMDVVNKIKGVATTMRSGHQDVPAEDARTSPGRFCLSSMSAPAGPRPCTSSATSSKPGSATTAWTPSSAPSPSPCARWPTAVRAST